MLYVKKYRSTDDKAIKGKINLFFIRGDLLSVPVEKIKAIKARIKIGIIRKIEKP
jgi:hypothetical protein